MTDRRRHHRSVYAGGLLPPAARIRPGRDVVVVNLSDGGVLVEGCWRLRPGGRVELIVHVADCDRVITGHVVRCYVHALPRREAVRYRTAIRFELAVRGLPQPDPVAGYVLPPAPPASI
jgi:hypothetical protein